MRAILLDSSRIRGRPGGGARTGLQPSIEVLSSPADVALACSRFNRLAMSSGLLWRGLKVGWAGARSICRRQRF